MDLKHEETAECFRPDEEGTACFLNDFKNESHNTLTHEKVLR